MSLSSRSKKTLRSSTGSKIDKPRSTHWTTSIEFVITAVILVLGIVIGFTFVFVWFVPAIFIGLAYAALAMAVVALGAAIWVLFSGLGRTRIKYILYSLFPFLLSICILFLCLLLVQGILAVSVNYAQTMRAYLSIQANGVDWIMAVLLTTLLDLRSTWVILSQFAAMILGWGLWFANIRNIYSVIHQIRQYDGAVTFQSSWLGLLGIVMLLAMLFAIIVY